VRRARGRKRVFTKFTITFSVRATFTAKIYKMQAGNPIESVCERGIEAADAARPIRHVNCRIIRNYEFAPTHFIIDLELADFGEPLMPGHFANLKCDDKPYGMLYRPLSVMEWDRSTRILTIYYKVVGVGTEWLTRQGVDTVLKAVLPLGNSFGVPDTAKKAVMVAGGVGVAPLIFLSNRLRIERPELPVLFLMGARTMDDLCLQLFRQYSIDAEFATDDGSYGHRGLVTELLAGEFDTDGQIYLACCGPTPMMAAVKRLVPSDVIAEASLEARMACGIGACMGCVAKIGQRKSVDGSFTYSTVCHDGPIFPLHRVIFD